MGRPFLITSAVIGEVGDFNGAPGVEFWARGGTNFRASATHEQARDFAAHLLERVTVTVGDPTEDEKIADAFRRGAEAMRKACRDACDECRDVIDALPTPEVL